jgi:hypothetical protein
MKQTFILIWQAGGLKLADRGAKTISYCTNGSSMCCTPVLLGVSMSGEKLTPPVLFSK